MTEQYHIAITMGRTFIRSALLDVEGNILPDSFAIFSSKSSASRETIIQNISKIIKFNVNSILHPDFKIEKIIFSFPAPFDYENGISYLKGVNQFDGLYRVNLKEWITDHLAKIPSIQSKLSDQYTLHFENDARLFGMGEHILREPHDQKKCVFYLMVDTTFGAVLMESGDILSDQEGMELKEISYEIPANNERLEEMYEGIGEDLADALKPLISKFSPDEMILGGNFIVDYPLFSQRFEHRLKTEDIQIIPTEFTAYYIFFGLSELIKHNYLNK